jgi:CheY-like chemotaxis protein
MNCVTVLVVEDVPQVRATAVSLLKQIGCKVLDTFNGREALNLLKTRPEIEVLFADVRMPGMSGPELVEKARRFRPDLKVVLTSGYVSRDEVPADIPFVPKPWRAQDLANTVVSGGR